MTEYPHGWFEVTLADVTTPRGERADPSTLGGMPFLGMDHIEANTARLLGSQPAHELKSSVSVFKKGDLLYGGLRPYLNKVYLAEFDGAASAEFIVFPKSEVIEQRFLQSLLRSPEYRTLADQRSTGDRPRVKFDNISDFSFALPPISEQRRIVEKLEILNAGSTTARTHLTAVTKLVEDYRSAILSFFMVQAEAKYNWKESKLDAVRDPETTIRYGVVQPGDVLDKGVQLIRVMDLLKGKVAWDQLRRISGDIDDAYAKARVENDDILVSIVGTIGRVAFVAGMTEKANIARAVCRIRPDKKKVNPKWLFWRLNATDVQTRFEGDAREVARKTLNIGLIKETPFKLPPLNVQLEIVQAIETTLARVDRIIAEVETASKLLTQLDERMLSKALMGKLVPQDWDEEPASQLVDRIQKSRADVPQLKRQTRKSSPMTTRSNVADLLDDWPEDGMTFEELRYKTSAAYDKIKEELFEMMSGENPRIWQEFDLDLKIMRLKKASS